MRRVLRGAFLAPSLSQELNNSDLSKQDKAFVTDLCYGTLRNLKFLDACLEPKLKNPSKLPEDILNTLRLGSYERLLRQTPAHAVLNEWVELSKKKNKKLSGLVNAVLRRVELESELEPATRYSLPDWLYDDWLELFAEQSVAIAKAMNEPEPLWIYAYSSAAQARLVKEGCNVNDGPLASTFAIQSNTSLANLSAFQEGLIGAQNPSSSLAASLLDINPNEPILDLASGNGIKSAQFLALGATVTSIELSPTKVKRAQANLKRLNLTGQHIIHDLRSKPDISPYQKVILDAPCSGTGTLRGHPEIKLRLSQKELSSLAKLQSELLETAWQLTAQGGSLLYAICALTRAESIDVIKTFLDKHPNATLEPLKIPLPHVQTEFGSFVLPLSGLDGFFYSKLSKA